MTAADERHAERVFHDSWAASIDPTSVNIVAGFEGSTSPENRWILSQIGSLDGKYVLDLGCGAGESSVYLAARGARCVAYDLSPGMLDVAERLAALHGVSIETRAGDAAQISFPDATFDIVYAANVLHHVDTSAALAEVHRVLKPGGLACTWDPLKHNPIINVYRRMACTTRTPDEHPLDIRFVANVRTLFADVSYDTFWYATLWILLRFYLVEHLDPNRVRYWKKIVSEEPRLRAIYCRLERLDRALKRLPFLRRYGWSIAVVARK
jgi:ubiquinone/menaquinone biosynthesis C-methylase UbiE